MGQNDTNIQENLTQLGKFGVLNKCRVHHLLQKNVHYQKSTAVSACFFKFQNLARKLLNL